MEDGMDIYWILEDNVRVRKDGDYYMVASLDGVKHACLNMNKNGRLLFNGQDIETESFMGFVGLLDTVDDIPSHDVIFTDDYRVLDPITKKEL